jgi:hypothetical protein
MSATTCDIAFDRLVCALASAAVNAQDDTDTMAAISLESAASVSERTQSLDPLQPQHYSG